MTSTSIDFPPRIPVGSGHLGAPGRGRQRQQRLVGLRTASRLGRVASPQATASTTTTGTARTSQLLASLGHNAHRLSLEWSRIEPAPGEFSRAAIAHYRRVLTALADAGLTAFVTLHHFTLPALVRRQGGWLAPDAVATFDRYCAFVARGAGRSHAVRVHHQRTADGRPARLPRGLPPARRDQPDPVETRRPGPGARTPGRRPGRPRGSARGHSVGLAVQMPLLRSDPRRRGMPGAVPHVATRDRRPLPRQSHRRRPRRLARRPVLPQAMGRSGLADPLRRAAAWLPD